MHFLVLVLPSLAMASSPSSYSVYNYDQTTPIFTPDGRVMQTEYASLAPEHSSPLIALPVPLPHVGEGDNRGSCAIVMASLSTQPPRGGVGRGRRGQSRLVELPLGPAGAVIGSSPFSPASVVLGLSGVLSDSVSLLAEARDHVASWDRSYEAAAASSFRMGRGAGRPPDPAGVARRVAHCLGDACQNRSFGGGIRPYGSCIVCCGVSGAGGFGGSASLCVTDPSGAVSVRTVDGGEKAEEGTASVVPPVVVGGDATARGRVASRVRQLLGDAGCTNMDSKGQVGDSRSKSSAEDTIRRAAVATVRALVEEHGRRTASDKEHASGKKSVQTHRRVQVENDNEKDKNEENYGSLLEVVIITPWYGVHRLRDEHVAALAKAALAADENKAKSS